jgi:hypothetical protein
MHVFSVLRDTYDELCKIHCPILQKHIACFLCLNQYVFCQMFKKAVKWTIRVPNLWLLCENKYFFSHRNPESTLQAKTHSNQLRRLAVQFSRNYIFMECLATSLSLIVTGQLLVRSSWCPHGKRAAAERQREGKQNGTRHTHIETDRQTYIQNSHSWGMLRCWFLLQPLQAVTVQYHSGDSYGGWIKQ